MRTFSKQYFSFMQFFGDFFYFKLVGENPFTPAFFNLMVEIVLYLLASRHFRSAVDNHQLVELCSLYCLSDHITVRIARDLN